MTSFFFLRFVQVVTFSKYIIPFLAKYYSILWICHILFIHLSVDRHLSCFYLLAIVNDAAINSGILVAENRDTDRCSGYIPRSEVAGYDNSA